MSILKNIMSPFIEFKEKKVESSVQIESPATEDKTYPASAITENSSKPGSDSSSSPEYQQYFEHLMEEANVKNALFKGTDFKEFIDSKMDIEAIADEESRYRTAFNVLKRTGLTKERLVTTGHEYIKLIDNDLNGFQGAYAQQYKTNVEQKEQLLQKKEEELQELNEKISVLNKEIKQMAQEITESKNQLNSNKHLFIVAGENKKKEIETELQKVEQYFS